MRYLLPVQASLAALLLLPVVAGPGAGPFAQGDATRGALERSLGDTVRALEELAGLGERLARPSEEGEEVVRLIAEALRRSESPAEAGLADGPALDERLALLRDEVARLEQLLGELLASGGESATPGGAALVPGPLDQGDPAARPVPTKGLDAALLRELEGLSSRPRTPASAPARGAHGAAGSALAPSELAEAGADPLRVARALYRAGRFQDALAVLPADHASPELLWWRGRALERLGRLDEADACWRALASDERAGTWAERAKSDLEFLEWKRARASGVPKDAAATSEEDAR